MQTASSRWQDFVKFGDKGPDPQTVMENDHVRVFVAGLKAGQRIPVHPETAAVFHFLDGKGTMTVDGVDYSVQADTIVVLNDGAKRGMAAETNLVFMAVRMASPG